MRKSAVRLPRAAGGTTRSDFSKSSGRGLSCSIVGETICARRSPLKIQSPGTPVPGTGVPGLSNLTRSLVLLNHLLQFLRHRFDRLTAQFHLIGGWIASDDRIVLAEVGLVLGGKIFAKMSATRF